ncbi:cellulose biosynthesis protein BcsD [Noviherbaspirillum malthae]|uniref:cellulose biosynthesis protein BcsD n=1 Tax=Noviherbaspirillum malthae TaxID=1260987 RepID=UPI0018906806|nr:cellulose biosynthesis protein BcsD [Noviherbaspirillum malthae]
MTERDLENYYRSQQVSFQWLPFVRALAAEFSEAATPEEAFDFFFRVGVKFAQASEACFRDAQSLEQLQQNLNTFWSRINWGWVEFAELKGYVEITHHASPLAEAFGDETLNWSSGLLEGFYQTVFSVLGAGERMRVLRHDASNGMSIKLRFSQT